MKRRKESPMPDRERILVNIASHLAQRLEQVQQNLDLANRRLESTGIQPFKDTIAFERVRCHSGFMREKPFKKGDLVVCDTSTGMQQNAFLVAFVEQHGFDDDPRGLVLRAIGGTDTCNYGNESFIEITGIPEKFLWEGIRRELSIKVAKAIREFNTYQHRYRKLHFVDDNTGEITISESFGGPDPAHPTQPYVMTVKFNGKRTTIKSIIAQLKDQGFTTRKFEPQQVAA